MEVLFLKILNMSISAIWIVLAVVFMRLLLKKAPKSVCVALWAIVALRLICPFSLESVFSLIPSTETIPESIVNEPFTSINSGFEIIDNQVNNYLEERHNTSNTVYTQTEPIQNKRNTVEILSAVWLCGIAGMVVYFTASYALLYRKVRASVNIGNNVYICDYIATPFILGILRPKIYIQSTLGDAQIKHILSHENAHIKRLDHWWKPLGFAILTVHWFNPAVWLAYILLCHDIEYACDEKVIKRMDDEFVKAYSETLLNCSVSSKRITACPVAFGEVRVKERIKTVLNYKKPAFWITISAILACTVAAAVFLTNPLTDKNEKGESGVDLGGKKWFDAIVLEVSSENVLVKPCDGTDELRCSDKISFKRPNSAIGVLKAGQKIRIYYDSVIQELYPAKLPNVLKVEIVGNFMPKNMKYDLETAFTGIFPDKSFSLYTEAVNASLIDDGHSPVHVFWDYKEFENFLKEYKGHWHGENDADSVYSILKTYNRDYFIENAVILIYTEDTFQFANVVQKVTKNESVIIINFSTMFTDSVITGYRCKFHAIGIDKNELLGVDTYYARAEKPRPPTEESELVDNTSYDVDYYGYGVNAAYFEDYMSSLYKNALNYAEVYDKTVYSCPIHKFKSYDEMKKFFEPYGDLKLSGMNEGVKKLLNEGMAVFDKYDTVFVAYVKSYNPDVTFSASTVRKQGNKLSFSISSNGPKTISDTPSGWFVLFGLKERTVENCTAYSSVVTDREFFVVPEVKTDIFKINKNYDLDGSLYTNAMNVPFDVRGTEYEMPTYLFKNKNNLQTVFKGTERLTGENEWMAKYDDRYFESKALFVCYFTAPSGSHTYGVADVGSLLRTDFKGIGLQLKVERTDPPNQGETDDEQGWIVLLETDKAHVERKNLTVEAYVEYNNTEKQ